MSIEEGKVGAVIANLLQADYEQLRTICSIANQQLKERRSEKVASLKSSLSVGQSVSVDGNKVKEVGTIVEIRKTRATVEIKGVQWNCPISILSPVNSNGENSI